MSPTVLWLIQVPVNVWLSPHIHKLSYGGSSIRFWNWYI